MMRLPSLPHRLVSPWEWLLVVGLVVAVGWLLWPAARSLSDAGAYQASITTKPVGPPWRYGRADARYTLIEYADLECPFCQTHFPVIKRWIDANPDVNWQWHHLPLPMHDPVATQEAQLAECAGAVGGHAAFWDAVTWIYTHTRSNGQGLPAGATYPGLTSAVRACLDSPRPQAIVQDQVQTAAKEGIAATPTLRLRDNTSSRSLLLHGPVEGDALLSALDLLTTSATPPKANMPADVPVGNMPR